MTKKSASTESFPNALSKIVKAKNKLLAGGAILLIGLGGFQFYRQTTLPKPGYERLQELLSAGEWKQADHETAQKMLEVAGRQQQGKLEAEDLKNFPCEDLRVINTLWDKSSKGHFSLSKQRRIWQSTDVNSNLGKFITHVGWGRIEDNTFIFKGINLLPFNLSAPAGLLPVEVTYNAGTLEARSEYMSRIIFCGIE